MRKQWTDREVCAAHEAAQSEWPYAYSVGHIRAIISDHSIDPEEKTARIQFYLQQFDQMRKTNIT